MTRVATILTLVVICSLVLSPALNGLIVVAMLLVLFSGNLKNRIRLVLHYKMCYLALLLIIMLAIGVTYNNFSLLEAWNVFLKYSYKLLIPIILMPLFIGDKWRKYALRCLIISVFVISILVVIHLYLIEKCFPAYSISAISSLVGSLSIVWSLYIAFTCFVLLNKIIDNYRFKISYVYGAMLLWLLYCLYFINIKRTGMLVFFALVCLAMVQRIGWKSFLYLTIGAPLLAILLFYASPKVHQATNVTVHDLKNYYAKNQPVSVHESSVGLRLDFLKNSWKLVKQRPIFGFGTGSFPYAYHTVDKEGRLNEPSNSYVHLTVQIGFVGLAIFMLWLLVQLWETRLLPQTERYLAQGIILSFMITSCFVSGFLRQQIALLYFIFLTVFFAAGLPHTD